MKRMLLPQRVKRSYIKERAQIIFNIREMISNKDSEDWLVKQCNRSLDHELCVVEKHYLDVYGF